jgi:dTDP-4-amino-4,6-dideoxygalactose transaminase/glycosyltransferase involved in cell wall biosynthesis
MNQKKILVTKSFLPPMETYVKHLEKVWESHWLTNDGELLRELEAKLKDYLGVKHVFFVSNGTIAMQIALKALGVKQEVITTPFSFPATPNVILWEGLTPVFVDISKKDMCIDPEEIEKAITPRTQAILAVHVYGNPCQVEKIERIAKKHNLKVIYDAAHTFGARYKGKSLVSFGDVSTLSFHATKLFHTGEGGAIVTNDDAIAEKIAQYRNFGWSEEADAYTTVGVNGKNSELHAAMGLANFPNIQAIISERKKLSGIYNAAFTESEIMQPVAKKGTEYNYAYYPVVFDSETTLLAVKQALEAEGVYPRRYFYPSLNTLPYLTSLRCPVSESISSRVLCLPLYNTLKPAEVKKIAGIVNGVLRKQSAKPTVTVGIPAHNEAINIASLIRSVIKQNQSNFTLEKIIITLDGCTDNTEQIIRKLQQKYPFIEMHNDGKRIGKVGRLNYLYQVNNSDLLFTLDGDVLLDRNDEISRLVKRFNEPGTQVVSAHQEPIKPKTFISTIIYNNYVLWNEIRKNINGGDHVANLYGSATMLRNAFAKTVTYPQHISADYDFLYLKAKEVNGFAYEPDSRVVYAVPTNITEMRLVGTRFLGERHELLPIFGDIVLTMHAIPFRYKLRAILKMVVSHPVYTVLGIALLASFRFFPSRDSQHKDGVWKIATTTKQLLKT